MTALTLLRDATAARPLHLVGADDLDAWLAELPPAQAAWVEATGFKAGAGKVVVLPDAEGGVAAAAVGLGPARTASRRRFVLAAARAALPEGAWRIVTDQSTEAATEAALGWCLAGYRFDRYAKAAAPTADLVSPEGVDAARVEAIAAGEALSRDLINTPARDLGPAELAAAASDLAARHGATVEVTGPGELETLPLIAAVGAAATEARGPRLIDLRAGDTGPTVTLVGKGVCFDTGGLNLKPGASMGLMKKDMGGAAMVLGLAEMILSCRLPIRLRVLIPAVENAVSAPAMRPGDVLTARNGATVEVNNTDAEGRLVLADALALATEESPDLLVSMATLTGAARVALGPDLAPFYTDDEALADALADAGARVRDPVWRLPFWDPYEEMIEPGIADLDNAPAGGFAGSITAALFLRRFAGASRYLHFDVYGWQPNAAPARPKGGVGQGARALFEALPSLL